MIKNILFALFALLIIPLILFWKDDIPVDELKGYTDNNSRFVEIEGMRVHYKDEGEGKPLVLLHGTAASLHTWDGWVDELKSSFRIIRIDLPAFGITGLNPAGEYSIDFYSHFVKQFLDTLGINQCYLAGNSLGGGIAWTFTTDYPAYVEKLILIDASGYPGDAPVIFKLATVPVVSNIMRYVTPEFIIKKNVEAVYYDDDKITDELVDRYYKLTLREGNRQAFIDRAKSGGADYKTSNISEIDIPVLIMWGKYDEWIPLKDAHQFKKDISNSRLEIYEAGHIPMEEIPEVSAKDARAFLLETN